MAQYNLNAYYLESWECKHHIEILKCKNRLIETLQFSVNTHQTVIEMLKGIIDRKEGKIIPLIPVNEKHNNKPERHIIIKLAVNGYNSE